MTYMFFHHLKRFPFMPISDWNIEKCTMENIIYFSRRYPMDKIDKNTTLIVKIFQSKMKQRSRIPKPMVEKYKDELCFMVDTDFTSMETSTPKVMYVDPLGYEITKEKIEVYAQKNPKCRSRS